LLSAISSTKFERSAQNAHGVLVGVVPRRGFFPRLAMDCSLWKVLPSLPISLDAQAPGGLLPDFEACACSGSRYGLNSPVEQLPLRSSLLGGFVYALPRSFTVTTAYYNFLRLLQCAGFCKVPLGLSWLVPATSVRVTSRGTVCKGLGC
jgi:hypothetical protein